MKLAVVGSRDFDLYDLMEKYLNKIHSIEPITIIISGGAKGADLLSEKWAKENNINIKIYKPNWGKFGKKAGYMRNVDIVQNADKVIAFWNGTSKGTKHSIDLCKKKDKKCKIVYYDETFLRKYKIQKIFENIEKNRFRLDI